MVYLRDTDIYPVSDDALPHRSPAPAASRIGSSVVSFESWTTNAFSSCLKLDRQGGVCVVVCVCVCMYVRKTHTIVYTSVCQWLCVYSSIVYNCRRKCVGECVCAYGKRTHTFPRGERHGNRQ